MCRSAFFPALRPALWPSEKTLRDTVMQFLPFADILLLTADEMELLLDTREYQVGLFALLRGHTQLVVLETEEDVHAFTRAAHAFWPGLSAPPEELAARLLYQISQQELPPEKAHEMQCSGTSDDSITPESPRLVTGGGFPFTIRRRMSLSAYQ